MKRSYLTIDRRIISVVLAVLLLSSAHVAAGAKGEKVLKPETAAARLYEAWHLKQRPAALRVATRKAVDKLFGVRWRAMKFEGCQNKDEGGFQCVYRDTKLDLSVAMEVDGGASAGGYSVTSVSFSSEE